MIKNGYICLLRSGSLSQIRLSNRVLDCFSDPVSEEEIVRMELEIYQYVNDQLAEDDMFWNLHTSEIVGRVGSEFSESDFEGLFEEAFLVRLSAN